MAVRLTEQPLGGRQVPRSGGAYEATGFGCLRCRQELHLTRQKSTQAMRLRGIQQLHQPRIGSAKDWQY